MSEMIPIFSLMDGVFVTLALHPIAAHAREKPNPSAGDGPYSCRAARPGKRAFSVPLTVSFLTLASVLCTPLPALAVGETSVVSVASDGTRGNATSFGYPVMSADGRFVAFASHADNLVPDDTNGRIDVFVHDRISGETTRVNLARDGAQADGGSSSIPAIGISADGRYVAFTSLASNLVPGDTNGVSDIFLRDRTKDSITRVSLASGGDQPNDHSLFSPSISADGRYVAFTSKASNLLQDSTIAPYNVFLRDLQRERTTHVSVAPNGNPGNGSSFLGASSQDGRYILFSSYASNLVKGDTNGAADVFVRDQVSGQTTRVSVASDGSQGNGYSFGNSISADGRFVVFDSNSDNLVPGDTNDRDDIFVHDRKTGQTTRVSVSSSGRQGNGSSSQASIAADGRYVAFVSLSSNLVPGGSNGFAHIYVHDRTTGQTTLASLASDGVQANRDTFSTPALSADGRFVAFDSYADNLVAGDTNISADVFLRDRLLTAEKSANLSVWRTRSSGGLVKGTTFSYTFHVANDGPDPATDLALTHMASPNHVVRAVVPAQGRCSKGTISVCRLGTLPAHRATEVVVTLKPKSKGVHPSTVSINAAPTDPVPDDNSNTEWGRVK